MDDIDAVVDELLSIARTAGESLRPDGTPPVTSPNIDALLAAELRRDLLASQQL